MDYLKSQHSPNREWRERLRLGASRDNGQRLFSSSFSASYILFLNICEQVWNVQWTFMLHRSIYFFYFKSIESIYSYHGESKHATSSFFLLYFVPLQYIPTDVLICFVVKVANRRWKYTDTAYNVIMYICYCFVVVYWWSPTILYGFRNFLKATGIENLR